MFRVGNWGGIWGFGVCSGSVVPRGGTVLSVGRSRRWEALFSFFSGVVWSLVCNRLL